MIYGDIISQLNEELDSIPPQRIYMGYCTDPYQSSEAEFCQTREVLKLLVKKGFSVSILTKSNLVVRDLDVLKQLPDASVSVSIAFNDNHIRQKFEANTIKTEERVDALRSLNREGIKTSALVCPVIPYLTDVKPLIDMLTPWAENIWIYGLSIDDRSKRNWKNIEDILSSSFPNLKSQIEKVVFSKDHAYWVLLRKYLMELQEENQSNLRVHL